MSRQEEIILKLKAYGVQQEEINNILNCKNWAMEEKENFVAWCSEKINFLSSQPITEEINKIINITELQYELYLIILTS